MFTPRQVSMGNKVYKLHIKHDAKKSTINIPPDHSIQQLKECIQNQFNVKPEKQILFCNGKLMNVSDHKTIKQAKIPNGSKIICTKVSSSVTNLSISDDSEMVIEVDETLKKLENIEKKANALEISVLNLDKERRRILNEEVPLFHGDQTDDLKKLKLECGKNGEQLMQLLETLDQITVTEDQTEHRAKRKQVATKLNSVLDRNDKIIEKLTSSIKNVC